MDCINKKNWCLLCSVLLLISSSFIRCQKSEYDTQDKLIYKVWQCVPKEACWYYSKYTDKQLLDDYTEITKCSFDGKQILCPPAIIGDQFCQGVKNLNGSECISKSDCWHYQQTTGRLPGYEHDIRCSYSDKMCCAPRETIRLGLFSNISKCGISPLADSQLDPKIVGGKNAKFGAWPWQVSIRKVWNNTHLCGGVLLNENWIVTAAHCLDYLWLSQIKIRVGEHDFSSIQEPLPFVERGVAQKVVHPEYNFYPEKYDLVMLRLNSPLEYDPHIVPICLPESDDLLVGENANVTGWGLLSQNGTSPSVLQEASVTILSNDECQSMLHGAGKVNKHVTDTWLCAGSKNDSRDACHGDSGGPLQVKGKDGRYFLAGTVSQGEGCAQSNLPGVYMRISKFVPWILKTISGHM